MPIPMPGLEYIPQGPRRDFVRSIHLLYDAAGMPSSRRISRAVYEGQRDLVTVSHESVSDLLRGRQIPGWNLVRSVVVALSAMVAEPSDPVALLRYYQPLWLAARAPEEAPAIPDRLPSPGLVEGFATAIAVGRTDDTPSAVAEPSPRTPQDEACMAIQIALQDMHQISPLLGGESTISPILRSACEEKVIADLLVVGEFLLLPDFKRWTAWDISQTWRPTPKDEAQRLKYWCRAATRYHNRMTRVGKTSGSPSMRPSELDPLSAVADCRVLADSFNFWLLQLNNRYAAYFEISRRNEGTSAT